MPRSGASSRREAAGQKWALLGIAALIVLLSVGSTLYLAGVRFWGGDNEGGDRYRHFTLTDAEVVCTAYAREVFGRRLTNLRVDRFSSRLDRGDGQHKIFMEADIFPNASRQGVALQTFINCFAALDSNAIELFQYAKDGSQFIAPGEEDKGMFGL